MSTYFTAKAIIGVYIPREKIFQKIPPNCKHVVAFGARNKFCPECGVEINEISEKLILNIEGVNMNYIGDYHYNLNEVLLKQGLGFSLNKSQNDNFIFGVAVKTDSEDDILVMKKIKNISTLEQELKDYLEPLGLWDETEFGLHAVLTWG